MRDLCARAGLAGQFELASAATSAEELGNGVYPPVRRLLAMHGIDASGKTARQLRPDDCEKYDLLLGMDEWNEHSMRRLFGESAAGRVKLLLDYAGRPGEAVADPWYTRDFEAAWADVTAGCRGLLGVLTDSRVLELGECRTRAELYAVLREGMDWKPWYGENLDALWDVLTGEEPPQTRYTIALPRQDSPIRGYAEKLHALFAEAGRLAEDLE